MPGPIITAAVAIGKAIAGSKIATAAVITAASGYGTAKYASWQQAKRRRELENQRPDPGRFQIGDEEPYAPFVYGLAKVPGFPFYVSSRYNSLTTFLVLSAGECEGLCGTDGLTANPTVVLNGTEVVRCRRITMAGGDRIVPLSGTKYDGALEIREYFLADGSQGSDHRRTSPLATYTTPEFAPGPDGPWNENYHEGDGYVREAATQTTPAGDATAWATGIPVWSAAHRVNGYAWVAVTYTQKTWTVDGQEVKVYQGDWPSIEFVMLGRKIAPYGSSTKSWSNNAARVRYDFLREIRGYSDSQIDQSSYTAAVTLCGQTLDARTSGQTTLPAPYASYTPTFTRYTIDGAFRSNEDPSDIEGQMDLAWAGSVVEDGGVHFFEPGADAVSKYTIGEDDLLTTDSLVTSPHPTVNERDNAVQARIEQSGDHGLRPLEMPLYEDAAAIARDGSKRVAAVSFRFVRDPIRATWLQRVNLARQRESDTKFLTIPPSTDGADYSRLAMRPVERATLTLPEHGVSAKRYEIARVTLNDDLSLGLELTEDQDGTYGVTLGSDGVYRVPLGLPPLPEPRFEFPESIEIAPMAGLTGSGFAVRQQDGRIVNHLIATWTEALALTAECEYRDSGRNSRWIPMAVAENRAEATNVRDSVSLDIRGRHLTAISGRSAWTQIAFTLTGDLTPPGTPTGLDLTLLPLGFHLSFDPPGDTDIAYFEIGVGATASNTPVAAESIRGHWTSGSVYTAGMVRYLRVRAVDTRGNRGSWSTAVSGAPLSFTAEAAGGEIYFIDIPGDTAAPTAGTTALAGGGTIPAAANIVAGSVAIDTSDGRLWEWDADTSTFVLRARVKGGDFTVGDTRQTTCVPNAIRMDGTGNIWQCNADGDGEIFTGIRVPTTEREPSVDPMGREIFVVDGWPPASTVGKTGDGAYTLDGRFGTRTSSGWPAASHTLGLRTDRYSVYTVDSISDLEDYPVVLAGSTLAADTIHARITLDTGSIYTWSPTTGNWTRRGGLFGAVAITDFPRNVAWSTPTANTSGGLFTATLSWAATAGATSYEVRIVPETASRTGTITVTGATSLTVTDLPGGTTTRGYVRSVRASVTSAESVASVTTPESATPRPSAPTSFTHTVTASNGNVAFAWALPTTNGNLVTSWVLEMRQAGSLYRRESISGRTTLTHIFPGVPAGTYSATLVARTPGGPGPAATIATITVPARVSTARPAPTNYRFRAAPSELSSGSYRSVGRAEGVNLRTEWTAPTERAPTGYYEWTASIESGGAQAPRPAPPGTGEWAFRGYTSGSGNTRGYGLAASIATGGGTENRRYVMRLVAVFGTDCSSIVQADRVYNDNSGVTGTTPAPTGVRAVTAPANRSTVTVTFTRPTRSSSLRWISAEVVIVVASGTHRGALVQHSDREQPIVWFVNLLSNPLNSGTHSVTIQNVPTGIDLKAEVRLYSVYGQSAAGEATFTAGVPRPPNVTGLGTTSKTATGITITGPSAFPANATAVEWFVALKSSPDTPLSSHPRTPATTIPWPQALTGLTTNREYAYSARYRNGTTGNFIYSAAPTRVDFTLGTVAPPPPPPVIPQPPAIPSSITVTVSTTIQGQVTMTCPAVTGATGYVFRYVSRAAGSTLTVSSGVVTSPRHVFTTVANGSYFGNVSSVNAAGQSSSTPGSPFTVVQLGTAPPPTVTLVAPSAVAITASWTRDGGVYLMTASWSSVAGAVSYWVEWDYDLAASENTFPGQTRSGRRAATHATTGNVSQLSSSQHTVVEGRWYYAIVRAVGPDSSLGPSRAGNHVVDFPALSVPGSGRVVNIRSISLSSRLVTIRITRITGTPAVGRYPYRTRRSGATSDLAAGTGVYTRSGSSIGIGGLTAGRVYTFYIRGQVGTTSSGALLPETSITVRTPFAATRAPSGSSGQAGPSGQAEPARTPEHWEIWLAEEVDPLVPPEDDGEVGDTATLLNDGSEWKKTAQGWQPTLLPG